MGIGARILVGMAVGAALGGVLGERAAVLEPVGDVFIRLLTMVALPLVAFNILAALTTLEDARAFGRLAAKLFGWFLATTVVALLLGLTAMLVVAPGAGMTASVPLPASVASPPTVTGLLVGLIPSNPFAALADGDVTQVVVASVLLGVAALHLPGPSRTLLATLFGDLAALFRRLVDMILAVAPLGIGALMAVATARYGALLFGPMARFVGAVWGAQLAMVLVYMGALRAFSDRRPLPFLRRSWPVWATTLSTTSSLASLTVSMEVAEEMRLPRPLYAFALPLGAQVNKDGTAIMLVGVLLFTARAAGVTLGAGEIGTGLLMALILSAGSGGIPGGGFVVALVLVQAFGLPLELAAVVGGIYRLVDMGNTMVNVMGDLVGTALLAPSWRGGERSGRDADGRASCGATGG
jgi:Na+/H+-dicarboxylate symporter